MMRDKSSAYSTSDAMPAKMPTPIAAIKMSVLRELTGTSLGRVIFCGPPVGSAASCSRRLARNLGPDARETSGGRESQRSFRRIS